MKHGLEKTKETQMIMALRCPCPVVPNPPTELLLFLPSYDIPESYPNNRRFNVFAFS